MAEPLAASRMPRRVAVRTKPDSTDRLQGVLGSRGLAYVIDSIIIGVVAMAFVGAGAAYLIITSHGGDRDVADSARWVFVYCSLAAVPASALLNLALLARRGQTAGQYILGLRVEREDGRVPGLGRLLLYLLAMHPLVFHPLLAVFWALLAYIALSLTSSNLLVLSSIGIAILCLVGPLVALISAGPDGGRRALHDRIAGLVVVRLE